MAASQGFVGGTSWGSPFNTQALQQHKEGWGDVRGGEKIGGDGAGGLELGGGYKPYPSPSAAQAK